MVKPNIWKSDKPPFFVNLGVYWFETLKKRSKKSPKKVKRWKN